MNTQRLAVERDGSRALAVGPLAVPDAVCLDCHRIRRVASGGRGAISVECWTDAQLARHGVASPAQLLHHCAVLDSAGATLHRLLPMPGCECVAHQPPALLTDFVSQWCGPLAGLRVLRSDNDWCTVETIGARTRGSAGVPALAVGSATAQRPDVAAGLAIIEALERYCAAFWPSDVTASGRVEGRIGAGVSCWLDPAEVFMPHPSAPDSGQSAAGLAAARSLERAVELATAELVERWLVLHCWRLGRAPTTLAGDDELMLDLGRAYGFSVAAALVRQPPLPGLALGFGAAPELHAAMLKARREAAHVHAHMTMLTAKGGAPEQGRLGPIDRLVLRCAFDARFAGLLWRRQTRGGATTSSATLPTDLDIAIAEVTTGDVLLAGLRVVRACFTTTSGTGSA